MSPRLRILLVVYGPIAERMSAPEIRGWEMAKVLARRHDVTVAAPGELHDGRDGIRMVASDRRTLLAEARRHDVLIVPRVPPYLFAGLAGSDTLIVADLYNPFEEEHAELTASRAIRREISLTRVANRMQLRNADVILCAVEPQRERLEAALDALGPIRRRPPVEVVAFGLPEDPPPSFERPMRERFPQIGPDDIVVLWWGNVWRWFDAPTALQAFARVAARRGDVRLVFTAGKHPRRDWPVLDASEQARDLAAEMGLLGESVFFLDDWVPQEQRHHYLLEADVGLTLHRDTAETAVAARGRYMDYAVGRPAVRARRRRRPRRPLRRGRLRHDGRRRRPRRRVAALDAPRRRRRRARAAPRGVATAGRRVPLARDRAAAARALERAAGARRPAPRRRAALGRDLGEYYTRKALLAATPGRPEPASAAA